MRFDWFVIRQTLSLSNSPTMLTTSPGLTAVSFLTNNKLPTFTNALYSHPSKKRDSGEFDNSNKTAKLFQLATDECKTTGICTVMQIGWLVGVEFNAPLDTI